MFIITSHIFRLLLFRVIVLTDCAAKAGIALWSGSRDFAQGPREAWADYAQ